MFMNTLQMYIMYVCLVFFVRDVIVCICLEVTLH